MRHINPRPRLRFSVPGFPPLAALILLALLAPPAQARELTIDLTESVVAISAGFTGTDLLLYGAVTEPGDVVVIVRGPGEDMSVRRKEKVAGVWVNRDEVVFEQVPTFYWVASSRPVDDIVPKRMAQVREIGTQNLALSPREDTKNRSDIKRFRSGLIRRLQASGLYAAEVGEVTFLSKHLFRTRVSFPSNVSVGSFSVDVLLMRDWELSSLETTVLSVEKVGVEARVFELAHGYSLIYGLLAVAIAVVAGWLGNALFRKG